MKSILNMLLALITVVATASLAGQAGQSMPPSFTVEVEPETVLRAYPLGIITKQAAFSHHGKAVRTLILPNGKEGWVYEAGVKQARAYPHPTVRTYTLVFRRQRCSHRRALQRARTT